MLNFHKLQVNVTNDKYALTTKKLDFRINYLTEKTKRIANIILKCLVKIELFTLKKATNDAILIHFFFQHSLLYFATAF